MSSKLDQEPSFSRWADEDVTIHLEGSSGNAASSIEGSDFELPMLNQSELENGIRYSKFPEQHMHLNGGTTMEDLHGKDRNGKYSPFEVENERVRDRSAYIGDGGASSTVGMKTSRNSVSTADVLRTLFFILVWYTFSTFLTLYNKTLLGDELGKFPAPFLMNTIHFTFQAFLSKAITWYWSHRFQPSVPMSYSDYFYRVVPTALSTALDVNLSNVSLVFISVTFATMCKSAAPIFLLLFAFAFRLESPSFKLFGIMMVISVGVLLTVARETEFDFWGFVFVMLAAVMSGFRWCMTQILLQKEEYGLKNPLTFMSDVTPVMAVATALLSLFLDPWHEFRNNNYFNSSWHLARTCLLILFGGTLAFFMVLTEYILVSVTSAVTVTIAGVVKEAVTILVAVFYFHDDFSWLKAAGLLTIMVGVSLFNWYKYLKLQKEPPPTNHAAKYVILEEEMEEQDEILSRGLPPVFSSQGSPITLLIDGRTCRFITNNVGETVTFPEIIEVANNFSMCCTVLYLIPHALILQSQSNCHLS
ncbi:putative sugar phosphate/phosphate translocator [Hibiscus syriacus]|uniref:Sugar phosphate/phosphate translocator n=1 Tax=Hibiscus syriacus TaxID=106335 RepID=A0A6A2ZS20_HIBSY|nr:putative sugar phosphate/phosphate translocator [Hibiscus syriacus]